MQRKEKLSISAINLMTSAMQHFCSMNDMILNWKKIRKFVKTDVAKHTDEAYTHEDVRRILEISDIRMKTVFLGTCINWN